MTLRLRHPAKTAAQLARLKAHVDAARARGEEAGAFAARAEQLEVALAAAGRCRHCGRELTDPESVRRGIGSTCWAKGAR